MELLRRTRLLRVAAEIGAAITKKSLGLRSSIACPCESCGYRGCAAGWEALGWGAEWRWISEMSGGPWPVHHPTFFFKQLKRMQSSRNGKICSTDARNLQNGETRDGFGDLSAACESSSSSTQRSLLGGTGLTSRTSCCHKMKRFWLKKTHNEHSAVSFYQVQELGGTRWVLLFASRWSVLHRSRIVEPIQC